jgi:hypothetical protein
MKVLTRYMLFALLVISLFAVGTALAQDEAPPCPEGMGCPAVNLYPDTLTADFYLGDTLLAEGQNPGLLAVEPGLSHTIDVRNIQDSAEGFGDLFVWADTQTTVFVTEGQVRPVTVYPRREYIRGELNFTCDVRQTVAGDDVACLVIIDGVDQPEAVLPGESATYILDPGVHNVLTTLTGEQADLWAPEVLEATPAVWVGGASPLRATFNKAAHLVIDLEQPGALADFYVDEELIATQVEAADVWLEPNRLHRVEARSITDLEAGGVYRWRDASTSVYLGAGQERTSTFRLQREYLQGFLDVTCTITNPPADQTGLHCLPSVDGLPGEPVLPGETTQYTLDPGPHEVSTVIESQSQWYSQPFSRQVTVFAGRTTRHTATVMFPSITISSPSYNMPCVNPAEEGYCMFEIAGTVHNLQTFDNVRVYAFVFPLEPAGAGWYLQKPPAEFGPDGSWRHFPAYLGSVDYPARSGDTVDVQAALVQADATYQGVPLDLLPPVSVFEAKDIEGLIAVSDVVTATVRR